MGDNNMWWYKPATQGYDPAAQAQKNAKKTQDNAAATKEMRTWDKGTTKAINNKNAPESYRNEKLVQAVQYLDSLTGQDHSSNPMGYVASNQAYNDALMLEPQYRHLPAVAEKLKRVKEVVYAGGTGLGDFAGRQINNSAIDAKKAMTDGWLGGFNLGYNNKNSRSKEALAVEYAANGNEDSLLNMSNDPKSLQKAVQSAYLLYNNSGDERYEQAGETARRLLMHAMGADGDIPDPDKDANGFVNAWQKKKDYVTLILQLSQGADAAATTDAYVDVARYKELRDFIAEANKNIKEHSGGNTANAENGQPSNMNAALGRR